jgi:hypothetical protein
MTLAGRIRYDPIMAIAQIEEEVIAENGSEGGAADVQWVWEKLAALLL